MGYLFTPDDRTHLVDYKRTSLNVTPIESALDAKRDPNDIAFGQLIGDHKLSVSDIASLLHSPAELQHQLSVYAHTHSQGPRKYVAGISSDSSTEDLSMHLRGDNVFSEGSGDSLIVSDVERRSFIFPQSGREVPFDAAVNEKTANLSVFDVAYGNQGITIRDVSLRALYALLEHYRDDPSLAAYRTIMDRFEQTAPGIIIAHELAEMENYEAETMPIDHFESELASERGARKILEAEGVDMRLYALYHLLKAAPHGKRKNISTAVLEELSVPTLERQF